MDEKIDSVLTVDGAKNLNDLFSVISLIVNRRSTSGGGSG